MNTKKTVISLSGGIDSTTLLHTLIAEDHDVYPVMFDYGSKHNPYERKAVDDICKYYGIHDKLKIIELKFINKLFKSHLLQSGDEIPEGPYGVSNIGQTIVPGRNLIFISILAGYAESIGAQTVALAVHAGDYAIYPDCRPQFIEAANAAVALSSENKVQVQAPFVLLKKYEILRVGYSYDQPPPYHLTRSCYKNQEVSCGKCATCIDRLEAFKKIGRTDPIQYDAN